MVESSTLADSPYIQNLAIVAYYLSNPGAVQGLSERDRVLMAGYVAILQTALEGGFPVQCCERECGCGLVQGWSDCWGNEYE
jgi:hypothetical protein